ncbi:MAG: hypothetical protein ABFD82_10820 [Syntrophaceae bacterium]
MKHLIALMTFFVFIFNVCAFAADGTSPAPANAEHSKAVAPKPPKETRISINGVVKEISDAMVIVERTVKGNTETMQFVLYKPLEKINAGDKVRISYINKDDKHIAIRVRRIFAKKIIKKTSPFPEIKPLPPKATPSLK